MKHEVIDKFLSLDIFKDMNDKGKIIEKFTDISYDNSHQKSMVTSDITAINFDNVQKIYSDTIQKNLSEDACLKSNDALYIKDLKNNWYLIEFKNGKASRTELEQKIYDSMLILSDLRLHQDDNFILFSRKNISYILVYNKGHFDNKLSRTLRRPECNYFEKLLDEIEKEPAAIPLKYRADSAKNKIFINRMSYMPYGYYL